MELRVTSGGDIPFPFAGANLWPLDDVYMTEMLQFDDTVKDTVKDSGKDAGAGLAASPTGAMSR